MVCHLKKKKNLLCTTELVNFLKNLIHELHALSVLLNGDTHIFSTFFRISTSLSTAGSSKSCTLKLLFLRGVSHSWQFPAPLTNSSSTQLSHLWEKGRGARHTDVTQELKHRSAPFFCCLHSTFPLDFTLSAAPTSGRRPGLSTQAQQHKHIDSPCPNSPLLGPNIKPNKMMGSVSRESLFTDTSKPISHGPDCNRLIYSKHHLAAQKLLFIFLMLQCKENSVQAWTQILPADSQASASPITEELLQQT